MGNTQSDLRGGIAPTVSQKQTPRSTSARKQEGWLTLRKEIENSTKRLRRKKGGNLGFQNHKNQNHREEEEAPLSYRCTQEDIPNNLLLQLARRAESLHKPQPDPHPKPPDSARLRHLSVVSRKPQKRENVSSLQKVLDSKIKSNDSQKTKSSVSANLHPPLEKMLDKMFGDKGVVLKGRRDGFAAVDLQTDCKIASDSLVSRNEKRGTKNSKRKRKVVVQTSNRDQARDKLTKHANKKILQEQNRKKQQNKNNKGNQMLLPKLDLGRIDLLSVGRIDKPAVKMSQLEQQEVVRQVEDARESKLVDVPLFGGSYCNQVLRRCRRRNFIFKTLKTCFGTDFKS